MLILTVTKGPDRGKKLQLESGKTYVVGCNDDASLVLSDPMVLKGHCSVEAAEDYAIIRNHTASAGTFVGQRKISQAKIRGNTSFRVGDTVLKLTAEAAPDPLLGKITGGYKLNEVVGEGGMGKVYRATQLSLHRDVAVKVLRDRLAKDKSFRDLFVNEARAAAQLVHPNVVQVYDAGTEGDVVFFSMEFIGQGSVEEILQEQEKIPWEEAILMALEAAHGLEYAESKHIVHRDIKPDNLMINDDGRVKIADLGLAKRGEGRKDQGIIGTPHFIPPEQALGKEVDSRADIYSLGATFFRMITGKTLFTGQTAKEIVLKHIKEPPPAASSINREIPDDLEIVLAKMLAKDPDQRYQTASEAIKALEEVCAHHGIKGAIIKKGVGKKIVIPLVLLLLAGGGVIWHLASRGPEVRIDEAEKIRADRLAKEKKEQEKRIREQEREARKLAVKSEYDGLVTRELKLTVEAPTLSVYDDTTEAPRLERRWQEMAAAWREFAQKPEAVEFEWAEKAKSNAAAIDEGLRDAKAAQEHKRQWIDAHVASAKKIDNDHRDKVIALKADNHWEEAFNICIRIGAEKPQDDDPFKQIIASEWVSPVNSKVRQKATDIPAIMKIIEAARKYFRREQGAVQRQTGSRWDTIKQRIEKLGDTATDAQINGAIKELGTVLQNFPDPQARNRTQEMQSILNQARGLRRDLERALEQRLEQRILEDRVLVANTQRKRCSLDPDVVPNQVMFCEFAAAINDWNKSLEEVKSERYRAFVKERIRMLRWAEYLFARFHSDLKISAATRTKEDWTLRTLDLDLPLPESERIKDTALTRGSDKVYEFTSKYRYKGKNVWRMDAFPMDWIYHALFLHRAEPRWKEMTPVLEFALGAFCFETMQYKEAKVHFDRLLGDDSEGARRYHQAARALSVRSALEAQARQDWEGICAALANVKSSKEAKELAVRANNFYKQHEGTIFYLDVKRQARTPAKDFYDESKAPEIPKAPPPP